VLALDKVESMCIVDVDHVGMRLADLPPSRRIAVFGVNVAGWVCEQWSSVGVMK
jgi:hypothetical protein